MINCEVELILTWSKNCVLADMTARDMGNNDNSLVIVAPTGLEFQIKTKSCMFQLSLCQKKMTQNF